MTADRSPLDRLAAARWGLALALTAAMTVVYTGFILLIAYAPAWLGRQIRPGLSLGILLGVLVIASAWALILVYVQWANRHYDAAVADLQRRARDAR